ncbi:MAG: phosphoribosylformylglycinamidine synthase subunit PurQ [Balneolaceae bacterium]
MKEKIGVVVFPGSNCDHDAYHAMKHVMGVETKFLWHNDTDLSGIDLLIIPGGFSYGDYLRSGAIARFSPIMREVITYANEGRPLLGICNGFQILLESHLLPGAMMHNEKLRFVCKDVYIRTESNSSFFSKGLSVGEVLHLPVSHGEGNYFIDKDGLEKLKDNDQVIFRYCNANGELSEESNFNGSIDAIAGICNDQKNILGMMPHPERAMEKILGKEDGKRFFKTIFETLQIA